MATEYTFPENAAKAPAAAQDFGPEVHGVKKTADFMQRIGQLKSAPATWSDAFAPALAQTTSD